MNAHETTHLLTAGITCQLTAMDATQLTMNHSQLM